MTSYLGCMLAHEFAPHRIQYPVAVEDKYDGLRIVHVDGAGYTRNGKTYESFVPFAGILADVISGVHVDTELMAGNWNETSKLIKRIKKVDHTRIRQEVTCFVFDVFDQEVIGTIPYKVRREAVEAIVRLASKNEFGYRFVASTRVIARNDEELAQAEANALARGCEGIMVKDLNGLYTIGRSWAWLKRKPFKDITVTITGGLHGWGQCPECMLIEIREARGSEEPRADCRTCVGEGELPVDALGAFTCVTEKGDETKVGGGFTDAQRLEFWRDLPSLIGRKIDVKVQAEAGNDIVARHPVFQRFRDDI